MTHSEAVSSNESDAPPSSASPNDYDIQGEHARGGLGRVLRAWDRRLKRPVALKELLAMRAEHARRFVREVEITARLQHPNIVPVYEAGRWPNGTPFYAMKFVSGRTLRQLISEAHSLDERLALLPNVLAVADAIAYAHSEGVIHRDLKPSNVLVGPFGETVVVDWGLAKDLRNTNDGDVDQGDPYRTLADGQTVTGTVLGTPSYMPPEQARGADVDQRADVYALGALLYHTLAGHAPYAGESSAMVIERVLAGPPLPVATSESGVSADLAAIVDKAMARDPAARYASAGALAEDLRRFQTGQLVGAHHYSRTTLVRRWMARNRSPLSVALVLLALLAFSLVLSMRRIVRERDTAERRAYELTLTQARTALPIDPTRALAWLKNYPAEARNQAEAHAIAADAAGRGVARFVLRAPHSLFAAALSPDGVLVVAGGESDALRVWSLSSGEMRRLPFATTTHLLAYSADGRRLAASGEYGRLAIWDGLDRPPRSLEGHRGMLQQFAFAPDGTSLLSRDDADVVCLWNLASGRCRRSTPREPGMSQIAYRSDGTPIIVRAHGRELEWSDARTGARLVTISHHVEIEDLATSPRAETIVTSAAGRLFIWNGAHGQALADVELRGSAGNIVVAAGGRIVAWHDDRGVVVRSIDAADSRQLQISERIVSMVFSPDGRLLAIGTASGAITVWDLQCDATQLLQGHTGMVVALSFSADGRTLISSGGEDRIVRVWPLSLANRNVLRGGDGGQGLHVLFSPSGDRLAVASSAFAARVWTLRPRLTSTVMPHGHIVQEVAFSPTGRRVASSSWDNTATWRDEIDGSAGTIRFAARVQRVLWLDETTLLTATMDGSVWLATVGDGKAVLLGRHEGPVGMIALSPDRKSVLSTGDDGTIRLWNISQRTGRIVGRHPAEVDRAFFLPGENRAVSAGLDGAVRVWNLTSTGDEHTLRAGGTPLDALAVSSSGMIAAAGDDGVVALWSSWTATAPRLLVGHEGRVRNLAFSPNGRLLASAGYDHSTRIWDCMTGGAAVLHGHDGHVLSLDFSPDGTQLATTGSDSTVRLWDVASIGFVPANTRDFRRWLVDATNDEASSSGSRDVSTQ